MTAGRVFLKAIGGTLTTVFGRLPRQTGKALAGTLTSSGAAIKRTTKGLAGTLTSSGALAAVRVSLQLVGGTLTSSGALVKTTTKTLAGTLSSRGHWSGARPVFWVHPFDVGALVKQTRGKEHM